MAGPDIITNYRCELIRVGEDDQEGEGILGNNGLAGQIEAVTPPTVAFMETVVDTNAVSPHELFDGLERMDHTMTVLGDAGYEIRKAFGRWVQLVLVETMKASSQSARVPSTFVRHDMSGILNSATPANRTRRATNGQDIMMRVRKYKMDKSTRVGESYRRENIHDIMLDEPGAKLVVFGVDYYLPEKLALHEIQAPIPSGG